MSEKVNDDHEELQLVNLGNGGAAELFAEELQRVLDNILDINTLATAKRQIKLTVTFKPSPERNSAQIEVAAESKLAAMNSANATIFVGRRQGRAIAITHDPEQLQFQWDEESRPRSVHEARPAAGE